MLALHCFACIVGGGPVHTVVVVGANLIAPHVSISVTVNRFVMYKARSTSYTIALDIEI